MSDWLIDKSAVVRLDASGDAATWAERIQAGRVRILTLTRLEIGFSARSAEDLRRMRRRPLMSSLLVEHLTPAIEQRAEVVQLALADRGQHRAPAIPDLLIAAAAELNGLTVLHIDKDFELIAAVTGQPVERLA